MLTWLVGGDIDPRSAYVLHRIRLPRTLMAALAGAILASSGAVYQALLRNPLAEPYTLGVSGGATLGAVIAIALASRAEFNPYRRGFPIVTVAALSGAGATVAAVYAVARSRALFSSGAIVLAGVALNLFFGSWILTIQYFAHHTQAHEMIRWMMGGLDVVGYGPFVLLGPLAAAGFATIFLSARELDALAIDPESAAALGARVEAVRLRTLAAASLATGAVVGIAGPIGFVGLIVPHCVRAVAGAVHARSLPLSAAAGALFLMACDLLSQNLLRAIDPALGNVELPVGAITAMLGGPFFLYLLLASAGGAGNSE